MHINKIINAVYYKEAHISKQGFHVLRYHLGQVMRVGEDSIAMGEKVYYLTKWPVFYFDKRSVLFKRHRQYFGNSNLLWQFPQPNNKNNWARRENAIRETRRGGRISSLVENVC